MQPAKNSVNVAEWAVLIPVIVGYFVLYGALDLITYYDVFGG